MDRFIKTSIGALIMVNIAMFVMFHLLVALCGDSAALWFGISVPNLFPWIWTPLTYMFSHDSAWDLIFGMLWLYFFSRVFMEIGTERQLLFSYLLGGLGGAMAYILAGLCGIMSGSLLLGSSAAALGIITCAAFRAPKMRLVLLFFGAVEFRWIASVAVGLGMLSFASGNIGGGIAHVGGVIGGVLSWIIIRRQSRFRFVKPKTFKSSEKSLDELLDKVKRSGYSSLSAEERRKLLEFSKKL